MCPTPLRCEKRTLEKWACTRRASALCVRLLILERLRPGCQQAGPGGSGTRSGGLAARVKQTSPTFGRPCIPSGGVASRSNTAGIFPRRVLSDRRITGLGATRDFHDGPVVSRVRGFPEPLGPASAWPGNSHRTGYASHRALRLASDERSPSSESAFTIRGIGVQLQRNTHDPKKAQKIRHFLTRSDRKGWRTSSVGGGQFESSPLQR